MPTSGNKNSDRKRAAGQGPQNKNSIAKWFDRIRIVRETKGPQKSLDRKTIIRIEKSSRSIVSRNNNSDRNW